LTRSALVAAVDQHMAAAMLKLLLLRLIH